MRGSEDIRERKKRKSPFTTTALSTDPLSPANPREYPHKSYLARNWDGLHFCRRQCIGSCSNFRTVLSESQKRQLISLPRPKQILTQTGHSGSFKVIYTVSGKKGTNSILGITSSLTDFQKFLTFTIS